MSRRLWLLRHGESMGNVWKDAYRRESTNFLSPLGSKQAELIGQFFVQREIQFTHYISSDLLRAKQTMSSVLQTMNQWQQLWEVQPLFNEAPGHSYAGDDFRIKHSEDVAKGLKELMQIWVEGDILIVSHYWTMTEMFKHLTGAAGPRHIPNALPFVWDASAPSALKMVNPYDHGPQY